VCVMKGLLAQNTCKCSFQLQPFGLVDKLQPKHCPSGAAALAWRLTSNGSANWVTKKPERLRTPVVRLEKSLRSCSGWTSAGTVGGGMGGRSPNRQGAV
jgi:hypothetical protein